MGFWASGRSSEGSLVGGAIGNLKLEENEPDGFRPVVGRTGVLGEVVVPGLLLGERAGNVNSLPGSCIVGGKEAPPSGEGCVAERNPGEDTICLSVYEVRPRQRPYQDTTRACSRPAY